MLNLFKQKVHNESMFILSAMSRFCDSELSHAAASLVEALTVERSVMCTPMCHQLCQSDLLSQLFFLSFRGSRSHDSTVKYVYKHNTFLTNY